MRRMTEGQIIVVSAPSGAGKGTVIGKLLSGRGGVSLSVSYTSRPPRAGETEGVHYYFVAEKTFREMADNGEFVEWDIYQGSYYGTSKQKIEQITGSGTDLIFDITIKGAYAIRSHYPQAALVFLAPPSFSELERRLRLRGTETEEKIRGRLAEARKEIVNIGRFDYYIVNDDAAAAADKLYAILTAERCRTRGKDAGTLIDKITG